MSSSGRSLPGGDLRRHLAAGLWRADVAARAHCKSSVTRDLLRAPGQHQREQVQETLWGRHAVLKRCVARQMLDRLRIGLDGEVVIGQEADQLIHRRNALSCRTLKGARVGPVDEPDPPR